MSPIRLNDLPASVRKQVNAKLGRQPRVRDTRVVSGACRYGCWACGLISPTWGRAENHARKSGHVRQEMILMAKCKSCAADVIWAEHETTGTRAPLDVTPRDDGNCLLVGRGRYRVLGTPELRQKALDEGLSLRMNHFVSCPNAKEHARS